MKQDSNKPAGVKATLATFAQVALVALISVQTGVLLAQSDDAAIPDLSGVWDGGFGARPVNSETVPWTSENFPKLNERAKAYQEVFEEIISPKYDCQPASSPAIQYDPYHMQVTQWPDRVMFRYEKDDQLRTVWLDGREPTSLDINNQGFSVGYYEDGALIVTTTHFMFDITGFDDYNGIPSSAQKVLNGRGQSTTDSNARGPNVPVGACVLHYALGACAPRLSASGLWLRPRVGACFCALLPFEV